MKGGSPTPATSCSRCSTPRSIPTGRPRTGSSRTKPRRCSAEPQGDGMNVLLLSMPDSFEHMPSVAIRMPNGALASLAGNVDPHHRVAIADLILAQPRGPGTVERLVRELQPDVVGLSVMTFQRGTALKHRAVRPQLRPTSGSSSAATIRASRRRRTRRVADVTSSCAAKASRRSASCCARSRAATELRRRCRACPIGRRTASITIPTGRSPGSHPNPLRLPNRAARVLSGYTLLGRQVDVVETSRGCTFDCSFCSIIEMRGRNFHAYPIERVLADIARRPQPRRAGDLPRRRQHHARRPPLRGALPRDHRQRASTTSTTSCRR